ncbi:hypothetical protein Spb1_20100 [Planctopirus ephydatiae]|uniref:Tagaturonate/fructuronate epimerase n=1 Tax=Planctopirus ephydatiae TaxID=2528019 RepID=A0A518GN64_9PLAN|nr:tagaturonate epimerase family protein [Planctopirus ephydatiae]QDV30083.1 hypothetical protein Spb1_20100 [Planctopirus ephydatiae]
MSAQCLGLSPSFGFGDRTGLATPGHIAAINASSSGILPIFAQQSIREMARTGRTAKQVMEDAFRAVRNAHYEGPVGADADHLKTEADVDVTAEAGFVFFTIDPSAEVDQKADNYSFDELKYRFHDVREFSPWVETYRGRTISLSTGSTIEMTEPVLYRAAVKYGRAIQLAIRLGQYIQQVQDRAGRPCEIELSVDETEQPTTTAEHFIIAQQLLNAGIRLVSLAPRFIGEFEKGVDFKGDISTFERSLADHAAIAKVVGPYKLSLHSGSDKLTVYRQLAAYTDGMFHVKTAGTSYLEALRVVATVAPGEFRGMIDFARERYLTDKATYHVSATLEAVPPPQEVSSDDQLRQLYLQDWSSVLPGQGFTAPGRQILHCTFGSTLQHPHWGAVLMQILREHPAVYADILKTHFMMHLAALKAGL